MAATRSLGSCVELRKPSTASRPSVIAFGGLIDRVTEDLSGLDRARRKQIPNGLEPQQQAMKALQQRVMQLARDAGSFGDARVQTALEFARCLFEPQSI